jgi:hypothetical protein
VIASETTEEGISERRTSSNQFREARHAPSLWRQRERFGS